MNEKQLITAWNAHLRALFLKQHYPPNEHEGQLFIGYKRDNGIYTLKRCRAGDIIKTVEALKITEKTDLYITANSCCRWERKLDNIYTLYNIVIDIDNHAGTVDITDLDRIADIIKQQAKYKPNTIIYTGRGLQIWYSIEPLSYKWMAGYTRIRDRIIADIKRLIEEPYSIDTTASKNAAGYFRMPGSYNTKAQRWGLIELIHTERLDIAAEVLKLSAERQARTRTPRIPRGGGGMLIATDKRDQALRDLISLRTDITGYRDIILFSIACIWSNVIQESEDILERVYEVNQLFTEPLDEKEIERVLKPALKKRYKITNKKIIELLNISAAEQKRIGLYPNKRAQEREQARTAKQEQRARVIEMHQQGYTHAQIADATGYTTRHIIRLIQRAA